MEVLGWLCYPLVLGVLLVEGYFSGVYFGVEICGDGVVPGLEVAHDVNFLYACGG